MKAMSKIRLKRFYAVKSDFFFFRSRFDEPASFSDESAYSFESLIVPYEMDGDFEDLQSKQSKHISFRIICHKSSNYSFIGETFASR